MLIGLVGRPSSGKSTFFKASTLADVLIASYPFATIKANHGVAYVKVHDLAADFDKTSNPRDGYVKGDNRFVPFELMDVAGLVEGASEGKGLGNAFLNDLAAADAFIHVVDMSGESDGEGKPVESKDYYPGEDIKMVEKELDLWYLGILKKAWKAFARTVELQEKKLAEEVAGQFSGLKVNVEDVKVVLRKSGLDVEKPSSWSDNDLMEFSRALRRESKKMIIAANKVDRPNGKANFDKVKAEFDYPIVACFAEGELALREADKAKLIDYMPGEKEFKAGEKLTQKQADALQGVSDIMKEFGGTGVQEVLNSVVFDLMQQVHVYPAGDKLADSKGNVLPDCYLMKKGSTALDFAFRLHTDIGNGFVKAISIKTKQAVGKDYEIKDGDGLEILTK